MKGKGRELLGPERKAKDAANEVAKKLVETAVDRFFPGGDNKPAKAVADSMLNKDSWWKAFLKVFFTSSETGESQFNQPMQQVVPKQVVPAGPFNDTAIVPPHMEPKAAVPPPQSAPVPQQQGGLAGNRERNGSAGDHGDHSSNERDQAATGESAPSSLHESAPNNRSNAPDIPPETIWLEAGNPVVQVNNGNDINPNPEFGKREDANQNSPARPSTVSKPAPSAPPVQSQPIPARDRVGPEGHGDPTHGMERIDHGHDFNDRAVERVGHIT